MAKKKIIVEEQSSSSESESFKPNKSGKKSFIDSEASEAESDDESEHDGSIDPARMVKTDYKFPLDLKLQLIKLLKEQNKRKSVSFKVALKHLDWSAIKIDGYDTKELKACLAEIMKPLCTIRTLDEMLTDYHDNHEKFDLKMHPDAPKLPRNAVMKFIDDNRAKLKRTLEKEFPGKAIGLKEISSYGAKQFALLPEKEKEKYKRQYKEQLEVYNKKKKELLKANPELVKKRSKSATGTSTKAPKAKKELPYITPFIVFRDELEKEGKNVKYIDAQAMYKNMPDEEKLKYIRILTDMDTELEKHYSAQECKIMKNSNGQPKKPVSAYNRFVKEYCSDKKQGGDIRTMLSCASLWKTMAPEEKKVYEDSYKNDMEIWHEKMNKWIQTLPIDQRVEQMAKHGMLIKVESSKKRKRDASVLDSNESTTKNLPVASPTKKQKNDAPLAQSIKIEKNGKDDQVIKFVESPKKLKEPLEESTPKRKKFKEAIASLGPYPSLTTAHYFMTQKYSGKPHKIAKAYGKLSKSDKKDLYKEMKGIKDLYFAKLKKYAEENSKDAEKVRQFHGNNRKEQDESIDWHKGSGTDQSDSDSSDSDSDSS